MCARTQVLGPLQSIIDDDRRRREAMAQQQRALQTAEGLLGATVSDFELQALSCAADPVQYVLAAHQGRKLYTIKTTSKSKVVEMGMAQRMITEVALVAGFLGDYHRMVPLTLTTHQDERLLYTVIKARMAIDLSSLWDKLDEIVFDEATARFYAASAICALDFLHSHEVRGLAATDSAHQRCCADVARTVLPRPCYHTHDSAQTAAMPLLGTLVPVAFVGGCGWPRSCFRVSPPTAR